MVYLTLIFHPNPPSLRPFVVPLGLCLSFDIPCSTDHTVFPIKKLGTCGIQRILTRLPIQTFQYAQVSTRLPLLCELILDILDLVHAMNSGPTETLPTFRQSLHFFSAVSAQRPKPASSVNRVRSLRDLGSPTRKTDKVITQIRLCQRSKIMFRTSRTFRLFYFCLRPLDWNTVDLLRSVPGPISLLPSNPSPLWDLLTIGPPYSILSAGAGRADRWRGQSPTSPPTWQSSDPPTFENPSTSSRRPYAEHGPYLRSLLLRGITDQVASSLANCTTLEEFTYLKHLQFQNGTNKHSSIRPVLDYVRNRATRLRVVTYNSCGTTLDSEFRELADVCRKRGIELKCFADNAPIEEKEPLICPAKFPRPVPIGRRRLVVINDKNFQPSFCCAFIIVASPTLPIVCSSSPPPASLKSAYRGRRGSSPDEGFYGIKLGL
ncbi:hypothetical protein BS47DRAFT_1484229 [Hydnum rufescens UP504]|uniref:Uncharacterized protein n=1 Tax=Hydnum rufescens UP504 TaxID=1448309 RepID=A0A9P6DZL1_9AGAM|nr:hypothetical protein BS47DRAFT_1484229 [Hydnum rufescens UP504]